MGAHYNSAVKLTNDIKDADLEEGSQETPPATASKGLRSMCRRLKPGL